MTFHEKMSWQIMYLPKKNKETVVLPVIYSVLADAIQLTPLPQKEGKEKQMKLTLLLNLIVYIHIAPANEKRKDLEVHSCQIRKQSNYLQSYQ